MFLDHRRGFRTQRLGEQAVEAFREADKIDQLPFQVAGEEVVYPREAAKFRKVGEALLQPTSPVEVAHGEAISWDNGLGAADPHAVAHIIDTLEKHPTTVAVGASGKRTDAAYQVGVLEPALDAAESAQASNSIEKMLCHQMAAVHFTAMRLLEQSAGPKLQAGEVARFTNAAACRALPASDLSTTGTRDSRTAYLAQCSRHVATADRRAPRRSSPPRNDTSSGPRSVLG